MFYIVESEEQLNLIKNSSRFGAFIHVVSTNDDYHPILSDTVAVYIKLLNQEEGYIIPIDHSEGLNVGKDKVYTILKEFKTLYTLNKKELLYHFNLQAAKDISLIYSMTNYDRLEVKKSNFYWFYNKYKGYKDVNKLIPIAKLFDSCEELYSQVKEYINLEIPQGFDFYNNTATNVFYLTETSGVGVHYKEFNELFKPKNPLYNIDNNVTFTNYNLYNSTSRPTNAFNSVNFAAIPKEDSYRKCFKPSNDYLVEFDFDGYHLRLLCEQIGYELTSESAHKQLAKLYFGKDEISDEEYAQAKQINFQAIYGKIPEEHKNLEIFVLIQEYIDNLWNSFNISGKIVNPISNKAFTENLRDMHPSKLMNYMMQSLETARNIEIMKDLFRFLRDKESKLVLYIYDALIIDYSEKDGPEFFSNLKDLLQSNEKYPVRYKISKDNGLP